MKTLTCVFAVLFCLAHAALAESPWLPAKTKRILVLGDSITYGSGYVDRFEAFLLRQYRERSFEVINLGLSSETVSGLSEPGHAGGKFPRPCLHERLERALAKVKPDLILACYGMNDGVMQPFDEGRFAAFKTGMEKLHDRAGALGIDIVHITPPIYDLHEPGAITASGYEDVLQRYSAWLMSRQQEGWKVIDVHTAMIAAVNGTRATTPGFTFASDKVHPNAAGHAVIADTIIKAFDAQGAKDFLAWAESPAAATPQAKAFFKAIADRRSLLQHAWLTEVGHQRPGVPKGLPLAEAETRAAAIRPSLP